MTFSYTAPLSKDLFLIDPGIAFLNHGSYGAAPRQVVEKYQWWQRELESQPCEFLSRRFEGLMREARTALAGFVHCRPEDLVYVPNATTGMNIVARSLALKPGDEILTTDHEYGALDRTWKFLSQKTGAVSKPVVVPLPVTTHADFVERVWGEVTPRTRVLFLSHITSPTALAFPVAELCRRSRAAGILSIVDGAHAIGQIPLDMERIGADFYSSNLHKWLCAPKGCAFLYARPDAQALVEPLVVSWGWESAKPSSSRFVDEQEWTGTRDYASYLTAPEAIRFCTEHEWDAVRASCRRLACYARERITAMTGLEPIAPDSTDWFTQMVTVPLPPCDKVAVETRLYDEYRVEGQLIERWGRQFVRVSIQGYNTVEDVDRLVDGLAALLSLR